METAKRLISSGAAVTKNKVATRKFSGKGDVKTVSDYVLLCKQKNGENI